MNFRRPHAEETVDGQKTVALKRALEVYLLGIALIVSVNWVATPLYHDGTENYGTWEILN